MFTFTSTLRIQGELPRQRWLILLLAIFFAGVHLQYVAKITHSDNGNRSAFLRWRPQLQELNEGVNVWDKYAYPNPPMMVLLLKPFVALPPLLGSALWFLAKALMTIVGVLAVLSLFDHLAHPFPLWGKLLAIGMSLRPIEGDLVHGNVNLFILFLVASSLYAFCWRRERLAGLLLALSIACKVTPALFIAYFLWKRAWNTLLATALGLVLFVLVIPALFLGWSDNLDFLRSWHRRMVAPYVAGEVTSEHKNQSLPGFLHRMLSEEASFSDYVGDRKIVRETHNLVAWDRETVQGIAIGCMVCFALFASWRCNTATECRPSWQLLAEFGIVILGMLLFCERTWKHHCVTLTIPFSVIAYGISSKTFSSGVRRYLGITLVAVAVLTFSTSSGHLDAHIESQARWGKWAQVYGAYVGVFLLSLASMFVMLSRTKPISRQIVSEPEA